MKKSKSKKKGTEKRKDVVPVSLSYPYRVLMNKLMSAHKVKNRSEFFREVLSGNIVIPKTKIK